MLHFCLVQFLFDLAFLCVYGKMHKKWNIQEPFQKTFTKCARYKGKRIIYSTERRENRIKLERRWHERISVGLPIFFHISLFLKFFLPFFLKTFVPGFQTHGQTSGDCFLCKFLENYKLFYFYISYKFIIPITMQHSTIAKPFYRFEKLQ